MLLSKQFMLTLEIIYKTQLQDSDFLDFKQIMKEQIVEINDIITNDGDTLLHLAFYKAAQFKSDKHLLLAKELIGYGADQNAENEDGLSPAQVYLYKGGSVESLKEAKIQVPTLKQPDKEEDLER